MNPEINYLLPSSASSAPSSASSSNMTREQLLMELQRIAPNDYSLIHDPKYVILPNGAHGRMGNAGDEENAHPNRQAQPNR